MRDESSIQFDEDVGLMIKAREGDRLAYEKLYCRYFRTVVSFLAHRTGARQSCEDLAQEVFTRVWERRAQYRPLAPVRSYLFGVAVNVLRESRVKAHDRVVLENCDPDTVSDMSLPSPSTWAQSTEQLQAVRTVMTSLTTRQRQAVELVYLAGLAPEQAARRLGCSVKTLYSHLCSARRRLRNITSPSQ